MLHLTPNRAIPSSCHHNRHCDGAILPLVAIFMVIFISFAAIAIDSTLAATRAKESRQTVKLAALAALEEYHDTDGNHATRMQAALSRANQIVSQNIALGIANDNVTPISISQGTTSGDLPIGEMILEPGRWYYSRPDDSAPCGLDVENYPCFIAGASDNNPPSAFRISGTMFGPIGTLFAGIAFKDLAPFQPSVSATSCFVPRHAAFIVDLSPSVVRETHDPLEVEFAFFLEEHNSGSGLTYHDALWANLVATEDPRIDNYLNYQTLIDSDYNLAGRSEFHPAPEEYSAGNIKYQVGDEVRIFTVDRVLDPEPLTSIMGGLKEAVDIFKNRRVAGDKIGIIFYDEHLIWPRIIELTDDFDYVSDLADWHIKGDSSRGFDLAMQHRLFPLPFSHTDMRTALREAMAQLAKSKDKSVPASDFVVLIGDGLTNCRTCAETAELQGMLDINGDGVVNNDDYFRLIACAHPDSGCNVVTPGQCPPTAEQCANADVDGNGVIDNGDITLFQELRDHPQVNCDLSLDECENSVAHYFNSMLELTQIVENEVFPTTTPIHVILVGSSVEPHTVDIADPYHPGSCLSDYNARIRELPIVDRSRVYHCNGPSCDASKGNGGTAWQPHEVAQKWFNMSENDPFYFVNFDMYNIARMTGGLWLPLRDPATSGCLSAGSVPCEPGLGRRTQDPYCRTKAQQIKDFMEEILGRNPYSICDHR